MDFSLVPLIFILLSLAAIVTILVRKFPQLTLLDTDNIPKVRETRKKDEILRKKVEQKVGAAKVERKKRLLAVVNKLKQTQLSFRCYVGKVEKIVLQESEKKLKLQPVDIKQKKVDEIRTLLNDGAYAVGQGDLSAAEKKFIAAIKLDTKNIEAYQNLSEVYIKQNQLTEAAETLQFLLQLDAKNDLAYVRLAEIAEKNNKIDQAIEYYQQALGLNDSIPGRFAKLADLLVSLSNYPGALEAMKRAHEQEPQNPKYLDNLAEISIMVGDKMQAESAYSILRSVNPENQKLPALRDKIDKMA